MEHRTFLDALDAQKDAQDFCWPRFWRASNRGTYCCSVMDKWHGRPHRKRF